MQTSFRQIPKNEAFVVPQEPAERTVLRRPKFNLPVGFIVLVLTGIVAAHFLTDDKSQEEYFQKLQNRKEAGQYLTSGEKTDFCELLFLLRDSLSTECVGVLDGINWDNPPKTPDDLSEDWEEYFENDAPPIHRFFKHKKYGIRIRFDEGDPQAGKKAHGARDHWHRYNPNSTSTKNYYLDKSGRPTHTKSKESHIHLRK